MVTRSEMGPNGNLWWAGSQKVRPVAMGGASCRFLGTKVDAAGIEWRCSLAAASVGRWLREKWAWSFPSAAVGTACIVTWRGRRGGVS